MHLSAYKREINLEKAKTWQDLQRNKQIVHVHRIRMLRRKRRPRRLCSAESGEMHWSMCIVIIIRSHFNAEPFSTIIVIGYFQWIMTYLTIGSGPQFLASLMTPTMTPISGSKP